MGLIDGPLPGDDRAFREEPFTVSERESLEYLLYRPLSGDRRCFFCGEELSAFPIVYWSGSPRDPEALEPERHIFLHPMCAETLGSCLLKDAGRSEPELGRLPRP